MNSYNHKIRRLLQAYPVSELKEFVESKGDRPTVIDEILEKKNDAEIKSFIVSNFGKCHQSAYLFDLDRDYQLPEDLINEYEAIDYRSLNGEVSSVYFCTVTREYYDTSVDTRNVLEFFVPIKIESSKNHLRVYIHTLARNIKTFFNHDVFPVGKRYNEGEILTHVLSGVDATACSTDINRGVKALWIDNQIDGYDVRRKKSVSVGIDIMDEDHTFKLSYPQHFDDLMKQPLRKVKFRYLGDMEIVPKFTANASDGLVVVSLHSVGPSDIDVLLNLILNRNA